MEALPELAELVRQAEDPLLAAATCSVAANAIDMGIASAITEAEVRAALRGLPEAPVHGDWEGFLEVAAKATDILYLADNAGEIAVDRLVIEALGAERVTVAVRGSLSWTSCMARLLGGFDHCAAVDVDRLLCEQPAVDRRSRAQRDRCFS